MSKNKYLYTIYRRRDDLLIAFEELPAKAAELMGIKISTFQTLVCRLFKDPGYKSKYEIVRREIDDGYVPERIKKGQPIYTIHRASDNELICHEQPVDVAAQALGVKIQSLQSMTSKQLKNPDVRYKYLITRGYI